MVNARYRFILMLFLGLYCVGYSCQKATTAPNVSGVASLTVVNVLPNSNPVIPVINTSSSITWFATAQKVYFGSYNEYSPISGQDTLYAVQNSDTLNIGPKDPGMVFYGILPLERGGIYSLFLCGADTSSPDYLFATDSLPVFKASDSLVGIRFVNLSTGSNPISINLEGSPNGSEVSSLHYKGITGFKNYFSNSNVTNNGYLFVIKDAASSDSLTSYNLQGVGLGNGIGLMNPFTGSVLVSKSITIAIYGSETNVNFPLTVMLIGDF
jgi:hypothetical protein